MRKPAYSLVELVVAVAVLSMLASFIIPTYQLILAQLKLNSAVTQVADFVRLTEQKTVTEQLIYGVTFTTNATTIPQFLYNTVTGAKTTQTTITLPSNIVISSVNFSGNSDVRFSTSGAPNVSGNVVIRDIIRNRHRVVEVKPSGAIFANQAEY